MNYYLLLGIVTIFALVSIYLDAYSDAKLDETRKRHHIHEALSVLFTILFGAVGTLNFAYGYIGKNGDELYILDLLLFATKLVGGYTCLRLALFNTIYNNARGLYINYIGATDTMLDKYLSKLSVKLQGKIWLALFAFGLPTGIFLIFSL